MVIVIPNGGQRHPLCLRSEVRSYRTHADLRRAQTQLRRSGHRTIDFVEASPKTHAAFGQSSPALMISLWAHGPEEPRA